MFRTYYKLALEKCRPESMYTFLLMNHFAADSHQISRRRCNIKYLLASSTMSSSFYISLYVEYYYLNNMKSICSQSAYKSKILLSFCVFWNFIVSSFLAEYFGGPKFCLLDLIWIFYGSQVNFSNTH